VTTPLKVIFAGTPDFAAKHLSALLDSMRYLRFTHSLTDPQGEAKS